MSSLFTLLWYVPCNAYNAKNKYFKGLQTCNKKGKALNWITHCFPKADQSYSGVAWSSFTSSELLEESFSFIGLSLCQDFPGCQLNNCLSGRTLELKKTQQDSVEAQQDSKRLKETQLKLETRLIFYQPYVCGTNAHPPWRHHTCQHSKFATNTDTIRHSYRHLLIFPYPSQS